jgi:uncharacterized iron-regulated membrane protein
MATGTLDRAAPTTDAPRRGIQSVLLRLHFYAGILVAPFLLVAAVTGLLYTVAPQIDRVAYGELLHAESGPARPLVDQVAAAQAAHPGLAVTAIDVHDGRTAVTFADPSLADDRERTAYVDPTSATVKGSLVTWFGSTPAVTWLDDLHRNLHLGALGRNYSEIAASWLGVVALGGVVLWVRQRRERRRHLVVPQLSARGRRRVISLHGTTGLVLVLGLLFLSATGLTWSRYAGAHFQDALTALDATAPELATGLPDGSARSIDLRDADRVLAGARAAGLTGPVELTPSDTAWTVAQTDKTWPVHLDSAAVDPSTGAATAYRAWDDRPLLSKLSSLGVNAHMGVLFGPVNQVVLAAVAIGLILLIVWGYRAWWLRRPRRAERQRSARVGRPPQRGAWRGVRPGALAVIVAVTLAVAWAVPWWGWTLLGFLVVDALAGVRARTGSVRADGTSRRNP